MIKSVKNIQSQLQSDIDRVINDLLYNYIDIDDSIDIDNIKGYITDTRRGRAHVTDSYFTVPFWCYQNSWANFIYYTAHELSHILQFRKDGKNANHNFQFYSIFTKLCPEEYQYFELHYKKSSAKYGISKQ